MELWPALQGIAATLALFLVIGQLRQDREVFEQERRPWIGPVKLDRFEVVAGKPPSALLRVRNFGATPAIGFTGRLGTTSDQPTERMIRTAQVRTESRTALFPGAEKDLVTTGGGEPMSRSEIADIAEGRRRFYIVGELTYRDGFDRQYRTVFCYQTNRERTQAHYCESLNFVE
jgi:hypothetical protein